MVTQTFLEFFCGAGMAREGLGPQWACTFANDIDPGKARSYAANFGRVGLKVGDVAHLVAVRLTGSLRTLAWSSFPCQDVSLAGDRAGLGGARSGAFWPFWRLMQGLRAEGRAPEMIVIENVPGLITSHGGKISMRSATRSPTRIIVLVSYDRRRAVRAPIRERIFIVAMDNALGIPTRSSPIRLAYPFIRLSAVMACRRKFCADLVATAGPTKRNTCLPTRSTTLRKASPGTPKPKPIG